MKSNGTTIESEEIKVVIASSDGVTYSDEEDVLGGGGADPDPSVLASDAGVMVEVDADVGIVVVPCVLSASPRELLA